MANSSSKKTKSKSRTKSKTKTKTTSVIPHCPECKHKIKERNDIEQEYFFKIGWYTGSVTLVYCTKCGCILGTKDGRT